MSLGFFNKFQESKKESKILLSIKDSSRLLQESRNLYDSGRIQEFGNIFLRFVQNSSAHVI